MYLADAFTQGNLQRKIYIIEHVVPLDIEPRTLCVRGKCANHYTMVNMKIILGEVSL